jgi:hypothetical protein
MEGILYTQGILEKGILMYEASDAFKKAIQDNARHYYWTGMITTKTGVKYSFENKDIVKGSGYITNQCCQNTELELGCVYAAEVGITLYSDIDRYSLEGGTLKLFFHIDIGSNVYEKIPMGIYEISEANRTINCLQIKAYDYMLRFEKAYTASSDCGTAYDFLALACETCGVEPAQSPEEIRAMPNGKVTLGVYSENDIETWRDLIYYVAQVLGCFATINRNGKLEMRSYGIEPVIDIPDIQRFSSSFSDFITRYTAVSSTNSLTQTAEYYPLESDDGLTMNLGVNPLLQYGLGETREQICRAVLGKLSKINYVPYDASFIGNPALDLGDAVTFSGGHADQNRITGITAYTYHINGKHQIKCVGKDPNLSKSKSKSEKNISGLLSQIAAGEIILKTFTNTSAYTIASTPVKAASIQFVSTKETTAQFCASVIMKLENDEVEKTGTVRMEIENKEQDVVVTWKEDGRAVVTAAYILNDSEMRTFSPKETWPSGVHTLILFYPLEKIAANVMNTFTLLLSVEGGKAFVDRGCINAFISGQGLAAGENWEGKLEIEEEMKQVTLTGTDIRVVQSAENILFTQHEEETCEFSNTIERIAVTDSAPGFKYREDTRNETERKNDY